MSFGNLLPAAGAIANGIPRVRPQNIKCRLLAISISTGNLKARCRRKRTIDPDQTFRVPESVRTPYPLCQTWLTRHGDVAIRHDLNLCIALPILDMVSAVYKTLYYILLKHVSTKLYKE